MNELLELYRGIFALKKLLRKGWQQHGVNNSESVADHVFGVSLLALYFAKKRSLNTQKLLTMALIHEACEISLGDITPHDGIDAKQKQEQEEHAAAEFLNRIDSSGELFRSWREFEHQESPEGKLLKDIDRFEMVLQAHLYEQSSTNRLDEFYVYAEDRIKDEEMLKIVKKLKALRKTAFE